MHQLTLTALSLCKRCNEPRQLEWYLCQGCRSEVASDVLARWDRCQEKLVGLFAMSAWSE